MTLLGAAPAASQTPVPREALSNREEAAPESAIREAAVAAVWFDRDLAWIEFNRRVLAEALDERTPLLERAKFLAIFSSNLDEFFMKRVAGLRENLTPERKRLIEEIRERLEPLLRQQSSYVVEQ